MSLHTRPRNPCLSLVEVAHRPRLPRLVPPVFSCILLRLLDHLSSSLPSQLLPGNSQRSFRLDLSALTRSQCIRTRWLMEVMAGGPIQGYAWRTKSGDRTRWTVRFLIYDTTVLAATNHRNASDMFRHSGRKLVFTHRNVEIITNLGHFKHTAHLATLAGRRCRCHPQPPA